jgi:hypothetical protein
MSFVRLRRWPAGVFVAMLALVAVRVAHAAGQFDLDWSGPPQCPGGDWVRAEVTRILHRPIQVPDGIDLKVFFSIERLESGRFRMNVETREGGHVGKRSMEADACGELASSAAVLVAILIDPEAASRREPEPPPAASNSRPPSTSVSPSPATPLSTSPSPSPATPPSPSSSPSSSPKASTISADAPAAPKGAASPTTAPSFDVGGSAGGVVGILPSAAPGIGLELGLEVPVVRFEVGGIAWLSTRATVDPGETQGADFRLLSFYGRACAYVSARAWSGGPCAGAGLEVLRGTGFGPGVTPTPNGASFGSVLAGGAVRWRASRAVVVPAHVEAVVPVDRPSFVFSGTDGTMVHQPARVGARFTLGLEYRFR